MNAAPAPTPDTTVPQPRRHPGRVLIPAALFTAFALLLIFAFGDLLRPSIEIEAVPVAVRSIEVAAATQPAGSEEAILAPGWIEADPYMHRVVALTDGVVEQILVLEGESLTAGQPVARLVSDDARLALDRAEAEAAAAHAAVLEASARRAAARMDLEHLVSPRRRDAVAVAELERRRAAAEAARAGAEALDSRALELADELARLQALVERGSASDAAAERLRLRHESALRAAAAQRHEATVAERLVAVAEAERAAAARDLELLVAETLTLQLAEAEVARADAAARRAEVEVAQARLRLERTVVRSPIDGVVAELDAQPGKTLVAGGAHAADVLHAFDPRSLGVRADVPISEVASVSVSQPAEIVVDTLPGVVFRGEVSRLVQRADLAKNTMPVKIRILDPDPRLVPDMLARVRILTATRSGGPAEATATVTRVFIPESISSSTDDRAGIVAVVDVRDRMGTAAHRSLVLGETRIDGWREVVEGLRPGEWVVLGDAPPDGATVRILDSTTRETSP